jgi:acyl-CoA synthetase (AMP-forming)/AMP-acid ligase II
MNLGTYLSRSARYWPKAPALVCGDRSWTFADLDRATDRLADALTARGLGPGDAVASLAWNRGELV